jgi:hypothetical protein
MDGYEIRDLDAPLLHHKLAARPFSLREFVRALLHDKKANVDGQLGESITDTIKIDQAQKSVTIEFTTAEPEYYMRIKEASVFVRRVHLVVNVRRDLKAVPFSYGAIYSSPEQELIRVAEGTLPLGDKESLIVQFSPAGEGSNGGEAEPKQKSK